MSNRFLIKRPEILYRAAAASDDRIDAVKVDAVLRDEPVHDLHPVAKLIVDRRKGQQHGGIVEGILREQADVVFKHGKLGRGRPGIDG